MSVPVSAFTKSAQIAATAVVIPVTHKSPAEVTAVSVGTSQLLSYLKTSSVKFFFWG